YLRVSTERQARNELSLSAQRKALEAFARAKGFHVDHVYTEQGASGRDENRRVFQEMIKDVESPGSSVFKILVLSLSRFMRDAMKSQFFKRQLLRKGVHVIASQQEVAEGATGNFVERIFEAVDQLESENNGERTRLAMRENATRGFANGGPAPF